MGDGKKFDCIFGFSVKSYVRNTINLSCAKILLTSVIGTWVAVINRLVSRKSSSAFSGAFDAILSTSGSSR